MRHLQCSPLSVPVGTEPLGVIDAADETQEVSDFAGCNHWALPAHFAHDRVSTVDIVIRDLFGLNFCERLVVSRALLCAIPRTLRRTDCPPPE